MSALLWHTGPSIVEHAHATAHERDACQAECIALAALRTEALAALYPEPVE